MHMIKQDQSKVRNMDLLWRYYEKNRSFGKAAHVLARLADMHRYRAVSPAHSNLIGSIVGPYEHVTEYVNTLKSNRDMDLYLWILSHKKNILTMNGFVCEWMVM